MPGRIKEIFGEIQSEEYHQVHANLNPSEIEGDSCDEYEYSLEEHDGKVIYERGVMTWLPVVTVDNIRMRLIVEQTDASHQIYLLLLG